MKIKTKQNEIVINILKQEEVYEPMYIDRFIKEYKELAKILQLEHPPVFCTTIEEKNTNDYGFNSDDYTIYLNVPDEYCFYCEYYDWTDLMIYIQEENQEKIQLLRNILKSEIENIKPIKEYDCVQIMIPYIKKEWVTKIVKK